MNSTLNGTGPQQPQTFDGATQIQIMLSLVTWNTILTLIAEAPWKTADPLVKEIHRQIQSGLESQTQSRPQHGEVNRQVE